MEEYHKIQTVFKRDPENKTLLEGEYSTPELEYLKDNKWVFTEKVDGTNIRVMFDGLDVRFGGRTDNAQMPTFLYLRLNELFTLERMKTVFQENGGNVCLFGEGYGAKIQTGCKYISTGVDFVLFDVRVGEWWLKREDVEDIASKLKIQTVPIRGEGTLSAMIEDVRAGFNSWWGNFEAEGIVARPKVELTARNGERIITKIKHKDFDGSK